jgi:hypothetical protein
MRNDTDVCVECGGRIAPGAPVAIVHGWDATRIEGWNPKTSPQHWPFTHKRTDHWVCLDCAGSKHSFESSVADVGHCENCGREIRHWDFSHPLPSACCRTCAYRAKLARQKLARRVQHESSICINCGRSFTPKRADAMTCSNRCRQRVYRSRKPAAFPARGEKRARRR